MKMLFPNLEHQDGNGKEDDISHGLPGKDPPKIAFQHIRPVKQAKWTDHHKIKQFGKSEFKTHVPETPCNQQGF